MPVSVHNFPEGKSLEGELQRIMTVLESRGINYPLNYRQNLIMKYSELGVVYPHILIRVGEPNIRKHIFYSELLQHPKKLLDFGCGTGDDIRELVKNGYPINLIHGFDIDDKSINLGFDLYLDRKKLEHIFLISPNPDIIKEKYDIIYSGSVIHTLKSPENATDYIKRAFELLNPNGILFGSTIGFENETYEVDQPESNKQKNLRLVLFSQQDFHKELSKVGFGDISLYITENDDLIRIWFLAKKN